MPQLQVTGCRQSSQGDRDAATKHVRRGHDPASVEPVDDHACWKPEEQPGNERQRSHSGNGYRVPRQRRRDERDRRTAHAIREVTECCSGPELPEVPAERNPTLDGARSEGHRGRMPRWAPARASARPSAYPRSAACRIRRVDARLRTRASISRSSARKMASAARSSALGCGCSHRLGATVLMTLMTPPGLSGGTHRFGW